MTYSLRIEKISWTVHPVVAFPFVDYSISPPFKSNPIFIMSMIYGTECALMTLDGPFRVDVDAGFLDKRSVVELNLPSR